MGREDVVTGLVQELRRGTIVLCVLARLKRPMYGYSLVTELEAGGLAVEANTLYPLLRRLEGQGLLQSNWETGGAKPRKYYHTTPEGEAVLDILKKQWNSTVAGVAALLDAKEEVPHE